MKPKLWIYPSKVRKQRKENGEILKLEFLVVLRFLLFLRTLFSLSFARSGRFCQKFIWAEKLESFHDQRPV